MLKTLLVLFLFSLSSFGKDIPESEQKRIEVILGIDKVVQLDFTPDSRIQIGNESLLGHTLIPQKRQITFKGLKAGKTSAIVRDTTGDIRSRFIVTVTASSQSKVVQELREFIGDIEGIKISIKGEQVVIEGEIVVPDDMGKIAIVRQMDKFKEVISFVEFSAQTQRIIARRMQEEIKTAGMPEVSVRILNKIFILEGVVGSEAQKARALKLAILYLPSRIGSLAEQTGSVVAAKKNAIENLITVSAKAQPAPLPKMVKLTAQFVELAKDYNKIFGFKWAPTLTGGGGQIQIGKTNSGNVTTGSQGTLSGAIGNLIPKLSSAKAAGHARVIQSGVIITQNGEAASINKTDSTPFVLGSGEFTTAPQEARAVFDINIKPEIVQKEFVKMTIGLDVSSVVNIRTFSNNLKTSLVVKSKESAVVGGMVVDKRSTDFDRNPPGGVDNFEDGNTSPLFSFIKSKSFNTSKSQFVVFVTPEIIESASEGVQEIKRKFRRRRR